ncbi:putative g-patch domain protein [Erysiphe neolycopersici]|uniref:Putative g-patch domain protein n=1 Tax=Erysiphe neolycopersici TaxID=212602 RepID=A0A420I1V5_9PEZI|nr:putative g-patch domain protein [Erysiphe neolycopersici]
MKTIASRSITHGEGDNKKEEEEEEEDYMNMVITEPVVVRVQETYTQRRLRKEREALERGRAKTKQELAAQEKLALEKALEKSLLPDAPNNNKGLAMMAKMGFKMGATLGRPDNPEARLEPVKVQMKEDRGGIGLDTERKRLLSEELGREKKKRKAEEGEFRERVYKEREAARLETLVGKAMRIAEVMHEQREEEKKEQEIKQGEQIEALHCSILSHQLSDTMKGKSCPVKSFKSINLLWRGLVRKREEKDRERRMRSNLPHQSSSHRYLPTFEDLEDDVNDKWAFMGDNNDDNDHIVEEIEDEDDPDLDEFNALEPLERLQKLITHLRTEHFYCFWCKYTYPNQEMDGCPGLTEKDHD